MTRVAPPSGLPPLTWLRSFEAAAREESFTAAADVLGLTQAAVSQQIRKLESQLGVALFRRLPRGVELSADGAAYLPHVQASFDALRRSTQDLFAAGPRQRVTVASPASFASLWLAPRLPRLAAIDSTLRLSIASVQRPADYDIEQADLEIRFGVGPWPGGNAAPLLLETLSPMCTGRLLEIAPQRDWTQLPLIAVTGSRRGWSEWFALAGLPPPKRPVFRFDSFATALQAARSGAGVLLSSHALAHELIDAGELVRLSSTELRMASAHWLVGRNGRDAEPDVSRVWSWLLEEAETQPYAVAVDTLTESRGSGLPMK